MNRLAKELLSQSHPERLNEAIVHSVDTLPSVGDVVHAVEISADHEIATFFFESGRSICVHLVREHPELTGTCDSVETTADEEEMLD